MTNPRNSKFKMSLWAVITILLFPIWIWMFLVEYIKILRGKEHKFANWDHAYYPVTEK